MRGTLSKGFLLLWLLLLLPMVGQVQAADIMVNGSFETGTFGGWGTKEIGVIFFPLAVRSAGVGPGFGLFTTAPTDGARVASHGFDGGGPDTIEIFQDVLIPAGHSGTLTFDWRAGWNLTTFCSGCAPRLFDVVIEPSGGGAPLATPTNILTAPPGTNNLDTGPNSESLDLSAFAGIPIRVNFKSTIPNSFSGPAHLQLDNVVLDVIILDSDGDGVLDDQDLCSGTVIPEATVPSQLLRVNRFALVDDDPTFDTTEPKGRGPRKSFTIEDTAGCSCEQIIQELSLDEGHTKFGCSISAMEDWIAQIN